MKHIIEKKDYSRVLLSETAPVDVPIIFSNNWFYQHIKDLDNDSESFKVKNKLIRFLFVSKEKDKEFIPIKYTILKSNGGLRHLGLLHPASQTQMVELYKQYSDRIIQLCQRSVYSIRKPTKISSAYYSYGSEFKDQALVNQPHTYFSNRSFNKLHSFFDSEEFLLLERKYTDFWSIDISKFFDSIYTHSISWAVKGKSFSKQSIGKTDFSSFFDRLMQRSNYNETNGIVIGNEVSRIFAEIILQAVDSEVNHALQEDDLINERDYSLKRYVDDYFIFSSSQESLDKIVSLIESKLRFYKLHINEHKTLKRQRPFITNITRAKIDTSESINWLFNSIFHYTSENGRVTLKELRKPDKIKRVFIDKVMASSYDEPDSYNVMCGYTIAAIKNKIDSIFVDEKFCFSDFSSKKNVIFLLMDIAFHLFNVSPTSLNSLNLSSVCYLSYNYFLEHHPDDVDSLSLIISKNVRDFFNSGEYLNRSRKSNHFLPIEFLNILCVSRVTGHDYLISESQFDKIFNLKGLNNRRADYLENEDSFDYFQIMAALFYSADEKDYLGFSEKISKEINARLENLTNIKYDSRLCYLFLDSMSCPYISESKKKNWLKKFEKVMFNKNLDQKMSEQIFEVLTNNTWFICWNKNVVFESLLEKKKLLFGY